MYSGFDAQMSRKAIYTVSEYVIMVTYETLSKQCQMHGCRFYSEW
jgi:hypothetical protein